MERDQERLRRYAAMLEKLVQSEREVERAEREQRLNVLDDPFTGDRNENRECLLQLELEARGKRLMITEEVPETTLGFTRAELDHPLFRYIREDLGCTLECRDRFKDLVRDRSRGDHLKDDTEKWLKANLGILIPGCETMNRRTVKARLRDEWGFSLSDGTLKVLLPERSRKKPQKR